HRSSSSQRSTTLTARGGGCSCHSATTTRCTGDGNQAADPRAAGRDPAWGKRGGTDDGPDPGPGDRHRDARVQSSARQSTLTRAMNPRVFLLSPAHCGGLRAQLMLREQAQFDLARRLRTSQGVTLGEVFTFLSGLYFRGKLAYARFFVRATEGRGGVMVITPCQGLRSPDV